MTVERRTDMRDSAPAKFHLGTNGEYRWIVADATLGELLEAVPEIVLGKHIAVTSSDSGPLRLTEKETARGWTSSRGIAYSPKVESVQDLPYDNSFDEWYVFPKPTCLGTLVGSDVNLWTSEITEGRVHAFVNYSCGFSLHLPDFAAVTEIFWAQMDWIEPEAYIAGGEQLTVVTRNDRLIAAIVRAFQRD